MNRKISLVVVILIIASIITEFELSAKRRIELDNRMHTHYEVIHCLDTMIFAVSTSGKIYKGSAGNKASDTINELNIQRTRVNDAAGSIDKLLTRMPHLITIKPQVDDAHEKYLTLMAKYEKNLTTNGVILNDDDSQILDRLKITRMNSIGMIKNETGSLVVENVTQERMFLYIFIVLFIIPMILL